MAIEELRRGELIDATIEVIAQHGFAGTTVRDIAEKAGCSPASVIYYFPRKDDLLAVAFGESDRRFRTSIREEIAALGGAARLEHIVDRCFPQDRGDEAVWSVEIDVWAFAVHVRHSQFRDIFEEASSEWLDMLVFAVQDGVAEGELAVDDIREWALKLAALIDGLAVHTRVTKHLDHATARKVLLAEIAAARSPGGDGERENGDGRH